jgi:hypothetical protein
MMGRKQKLRAGERDATDGETRKFVITHGRPQIKRRINRRWRRQAKQEIAQTKT